MVKRYPVTGFFLALPLWAALPAGAQDVADDGGSDRRAEILEQYDSNGDGRIDRDEYGALRGASRATRRAAGGRPRAVRRRWRRPHRPGRARCPARRPTRQRVGEVRRGRRRPHRPRRAPGQVAGSRQQPAGAAAAGRGRTGRTRPASAGSGREPRPPLRSPRPRRQPARPRRWARHELGEPFPVGAGVRERAPIAASVVRDRDNNPPVASVGAARTWRILPVRAAAAARARTGAGGGAEVLGGGAKTPMAPSPSRSPPPFSPLPALRRRRRAASPRTRRDPRRRSSLGCRRRGAPR